MGKDGFNHEVK